MMMLLSDWAGNVAFCWVALLSRLPFVGLSGVSMVTDGWDDVCSRTVSFSCSLAGWLRGPEGVQRTSAVSLLPDRLLPLDRVVKRKQRPNRPKLIQKLYSQAIMLDMFQHFQTFFGRFFHIWSWFSVSGLSSELPVTILMRG